MIDAPYRYGLLHPAPRDAGDHGRNDALLGPSTLGIEVTIPHYAARCGLGNIDPQHDGGPDPRAAIEVCLDCELPAAGTILVTIRPDIDALAGMALLTLRARHMPLSRALHARVSAAAGQDKFARGPWPGPRSLPSSLAGLLESQDGGSALAALAACVADHATPLSARVQACADWLLEGHGPAAYRPVVLTRAEELWRALQAGLLRVDRRMDGRIAVVEGAAEGAIRLGYFLAPVVLGLHPDFRHTGGTPYRKFTLCQYAKGHVDLSEVAAELNRREPGWGGSPTIIGSPQGRGSVLSVEEVVAVLALHLAK